MTFINAPPNSLIDSNVYPKVKTMEEGVGVYSFAHKVGSIKIDLKIFVKVRQLQHWCLHQNVFQGFEGHIACFIPFINL